MPGLLKQILAAGGHSRPNWSVSFMFLVRMWIILSALASVAGWTLSALGWLNGAGYAAFAALALAGAVLTRREWLAGEVCCSWTGVKRRFRRPLPLAFGGLAVLVFLGGALYAPSNYDGLTYRLPRVLHWLADGRWQWIHTVDPRMNDRNCGFEWLMTPVLLATRCDRALFLINFLPFLLLPGLVFSVCRRLGVGGRVAWYWMWLLPTGYTYLLQAASVSNDAFAAVYELAAVDFALRAATSRRLADVYFSLVAAALLTGAKASNLPLLLPWFIVFLPVASQLLLRPLASLGVALVGLVVSFVPTALLNIHYCGDWTGLVLERAILAMRNPLLGVAGNSVMFLVSNFVPTFFPLAGWWNRTVPARLPEGISGLIHHFEAGFSNLGELPTEEWSGLGFGVSCLLVASVLATWFDRSPRLAPRPGWRNGAVLAAPYVALFFFFAKSGMETLARLVAAYYPLLLPALLRGPAAGVLVRRRWWRWATVGVLLLAVAAVVLTPARPLWPAQTVLAKMSGYGRGHALFERVREVYSVYADRPDSLAKVRALIPAEAVVVGFAGDKNETEISLWRPYGHRRVEDILPGESGGEIRARGVEYVVVSELFLRRQGQEIQAWRHGHGGELVGSVAATMLVAMGPHFWYVVRFAGPGDGDGGAKTANSP